MEYKSVYGKISISWKKEKDTYQVQVMVPANTKAEIELPGIMEVVGNGVYQYVVKG